MRAAANFRCECDRCAQRAADRRSIAQLAGLGTGAVLIGAIEAVRHLAPLAMELLK